MDLPSSHTIPLSWINANACAAIRWRTLTEIAPPTRVDPTELDALQKEVIRAKAVRQIATKQRDNGAWASNILALGPSKIDGIRDVGTVAQYRRLLELGMPPDDHYLLRSNRLFFRLLSRDPDPKLEFEFKKRSKGDPEFASWSRDLMREAIAATLAQAGHSEDPRVRGAAQRTTNTTSNFLRSEYVENPFIKDGAKTVLHPEAKPPTFFTLAVAAYLPALQRERAGFVERLARFVTEPKREKPYWLKIGSSKLKPVFHLLGDPLHLDSASRPKDLPFTLYWLELLARVGALHMSSTAQRAFARLAKDCTDEGVWEVRNLRSIPKSDSGMANVAFPLELDGKTPERRRADVTFRLALIAKLAGLELEFV